MCKGRGVPGSSTTSSGNRGRRATKSPISRARRTERAVRLYDICNLVLPGSRLDLPRRGGYNPSMELVGQVVVVTGASMGIGEAIAQGLADQGARVTLPSRDAATPAPE